MIAHQSEQSRLNGAKSKGPITIDGKARSSRNAIKHGFAATINNVISIEEEPEFQLHLEGFRASFHPQCYVEQTLVDELASIGWRKARLVATETALIDCQISIQKDKLEELYPLCSQDPYFHLATAWQALAHQPQRPPGHNDQPADPGIPPEGYDISSIELVRRYLTSLDRQYRNTLLNLRQYRKDFAASPPQPNEPEAPREIKTEHSPVAATPPVPVPASPQEDDKVACTPVHEPATASTPRLLNLTQNEPESRQALRGLSGPSFIHGDRR